MPDQECKTKAQQPSERMCLIALPHVVDVYCWYLAGGELVLTLALGTASAPPQSRGLVPTPHPLASRCPTEEADSDQIQGDEEGVPQYPEVHHYLRLYQPLYQVLVLDPPCQGFVPALRMALGALGLSVCPCCSACLL